MSALAPCPHGCGKTFDSLTAFMEHGCVTGRGLPCEGHPGCEGLVFCRAPIDKEKAVEELAEAAILFAHNNNCFDSNECFGDCVQSAKDGLIDAAIKYSALTKEGA